MTYINSYKDQNWLLPPSIKQMIPENHICFFISEFTDNLDFSGFDQKFEGAGAPAYHPRILVKILLQGMLSKERSSRKIASACRENLVFMYLAEKVNPDFRTICRFRKENTSFIKEVFKETVKLASKNNLLDLSLICIDGTTIKASANKKKCLKREQIEPLNSIIDRMIEEDIKQDEIDKTIFKDSEENLTEMDKRDFKKIVNEYRRAKDKTKIKRNFEKVKQEFEKDSKTKRISLSDPECRMMQNKKRVNEFSYNAQFSADSKNQIILANDVCNAGHDVAQLQPQVKQVKENIELDEDSGIGADCGYSSSGNLKFLEDEKLNGYIPNRAQAQKFDGKAQTLNHDQYDYDEKENELIVEGERFSFSGIYEKKDGRNICSFYSKKLKKKKDVPEFFRERLRMKERMETEESQKIYARRKCIVEPVIGNIKQNLGFREFSLRGLDNVKIELNLISIVHNLKKIWVMRGVVGKNNLKIIFWQIVDCEKRNHETASAVKRS